MKISMIAAMAKGSRAIGVGNDLPWHLPKEFQYFKDKTQGKPVVMGRKTYDSLPFKPLPKRTNIVVTRDSSYTAEGAVVVSSLEKGVEVAKFEMPEEVMVIGGGQIYAQALEQGLIDRIYLTEVEIDVEGDAFFPEFDTSVYKEVSRIPQEEKGIYYDFVVYEK